MMRIGIVTHPLLDEIEAFLEQTGMSASLFGERAVNNRVFVADMRGGRQPAERTQIKCRDLMDRVRSGRAPLGDYRRQRSPEQRQAHVAEAERTVDMGAESVARKAARMGSEALLAGYRRYFANRAARIAADAEAEA